MKGDLVIDRKNYRGPHSVHVYLHRLLGKHLTVIHGAVPLVNYLVHQPEVRIVHLGQIKPVRHVEAWRLMIKRHHRSFGLRLTIMDGWALQVVVVTTRSMKYREKLEMDLLLKFPDR